MAKPVERWGQALRDEEGNIVPHGAPGRQPPDPGRAPRPARQCFLVGRGSECDVQIDDESVSRRHAEIERLSGGRLHVTDRRSTNGTFILADGEWREIRQQMVTPADRVRFGTLVLTGDELDARCARVRERQVPGSSPLPPPVDNRPGPRPRAVRDPNTGELVRPKR